MALRPRVAPGLPVRVTADGCPPRAINRNLRRCPSRLHRPSVRRERRGSPPRPPPSTPDTPATPRRPGALTQRCRGPSKRRTVRGRRTRAEVPLIAVPRYRRSGAHRCRSVERVARLPVDDLGGPAAGRDRVGQLCGRAREQGEGAPVDRQHVGDAQQLRGERGPGRRYRPDRRGPGTSASNPCSTSCSAMCWSSMAGTPMMSPIPTRWCVPSAYARRFMVVRTAR